MIFFFFQNVTCREYNEVLDKDAAIMILKVCSLVGLFLIGLRCGFPNLGWLRLEIQLQAVNEAEYP